MRITGTALLLAALCTTLWLIDRGASAQPADAPATRPAQPGAGPATRPRAVVSPQIAADRRVTFRVVAPNATRVVLSGEFMKESAPLARDAAGVWSVTVGPIEPEIYYYNLSIDGVKTIDPLNPEIKTGSNPSTTSSVLAVRGDGPAFYDPQNVPHGEIHTLYYTSKTVKSIRRVVVYTPPTFDPATHAGLPVLYLLHGANADETSWHELGHANDIMDNLLAAGKAKPFIVVMPLGYANAGNQRGQGTDLFGRDLIDDLIPFIQARYRTATDAEHRALVGLSMGGGQAMSVGLNHLDLFSYVGGFSAGLPGADGIPRAYAPVADPAARAKLRLIWLACGKDDQGHMRNTRALSEYLTKNSVKHTFLETEGAHTWIVWRRYLNDMAPLLFQ